VSKRGREGEERKKERERRGQQIPFVVLFVLPKRYDECGPLSLFAITYWKFRPILDINNVMHRAAYSTKTIHNRPQAKF